MSVLNFVPIFAVGLSALFGKQQASKNPALALHPENPHYFLFQGKPTILLGSGEHYGAVLNLDFNYMKYLDELQAQELNHTRTFSGVYVEPEGAFRISKNTLAPAADRFICPWLRSTTPGYAQGGNKFDLKQWDPRYFDRLKDFVGQASQRGIVVEMVLFCPFYEEKQWELSPLNGANNINEFEEVARTDVFVLKDNTDLLSVQEAMVQKIVTELLPFDNVYYEVCNEPYMGGVPADWQQRIIELIEETEKESSNKHLISMNIANGTELVRRPAKGISVFNFHYASPPDAVITNYKRLGKVIGDNETGFLGTDDLPYRNEAWNFIIAGGGLFSHLDYSFAVGHEDGTFDYPETQPGGGNRGFRKQMKFLKDFVYGFDFIHMKPDASFIRKGVPVGHTARALRHEDKAFAVYISETPVPKHQFSVRWDGKIKPRYSETYTFFTESNDGVKLYINGKSIIQNWTDHSVREDKGTVDLKAGKQHSIRFEYYQNGGNATVKLYWESPSQPRELVPESQLYLPRGVKHGLQGKYYTGLQFNRLWRSHPDATIDFDWSSTSPFTGVFGEIKEDYVVELTLSIKAGSYMTEWINPGTGKIEKQESIDFIPGETILVSPPFSGDIALGIKKE